MAEGGCEQNEDTDKCLQKHIYVCMHACRCAVCGAYTHVSVCLHICSQASMSLWRNETAGSYSLQPAWKERVLCLVPESLSSKSEAAIFPALISIEGSSSPWDTHGVGHPVK